MKVFKFLKLLITDKWFRLEINYLMDKPAPSLSQREEEFLKEVFQSKNLAQLYDDNLEKMYYDKGLADEKPR